MIVKSNKSTKTNKARKQTRPKTILSATAMSMAVAALPTAAIPKSADSFTTQLTNTSHNISMESNLVGNSAIVGVAPVPTGGYLEVSGTGEVSALDGAQYYGSTQGMTLNKPIVGIASTPGGHGYWLVASDGGIFSFGSAKFYGSTGAMTLNKPVVGMAVDPSTGGYWLVASDGGIFSFNAPFRGSTGGMTLNKPIVGMASTHNGNGYWLVASDGGIFSFGSAKFYGSTGNLSLSSPVVGMAPMSGGNGYWEETANGNSYANTTAGTNLLPNNPVSAAAVSLAEQQVGKQYVWGAPSSYTVSNPSAFDCSGLTQWVWYQTDGVVLPRTAQNQYYGTTRVSASNLQPGNLIFYGTNTSNISHVAMYVGNGDIVAANDPQQGIMKTPISWDGTPVGYGVVD